MERFLMISTGLVILDQLTKIIFTGKEYALTSFLALSYAQNWGASFGILQGGRWLFILAAAIVIFCTFKYRDTFKSKAGLILLLAGATGNLIDRVVLGYVRDFISVWVWPTFNLADAFSVAGVGLLALEMIREERKTRSFINKNANNKK